MASGGDQKPEVRYKDVQDTFHAKGLEYLKLPGNAKKTDRLAALDAWNAAAIDFFTLCNELCFNETEKSLFFKNSGYAVDWLGKAAKHYGEVFSQAGSLQANLQHYEPGDYKFKQLQELVRDKEPTAALDLRTRFIQAKLPTYGFDDPTVKRDETPHWVWIPAICFTAVLLLVFVALLIRKDEMSDFQQDLANKLFAIFAGLTTTFLGGTALFSLEVPTNKALRVGFSATAGVAVVAFVWVFAPYWFKLKPLPPGIGASPAGPLYECSLSVKSDLSPFVAIKPTDPRYPDPRYLRLAAPEMADIPCYMMQDDMHNLIIGFVFGGLCQVRTGAFSRNSLNSLSLRDEEAQAKSLWELLGRTGEFLSEYVHPNYWKPRETFVDNGRYHTDLIYIFDKSFRSAVPQVTAFQVLRAMYCEDPGIRGTENSSRIKKDVANVLEQLWPKPGVSEPFRSKEDGKLIKNLLLRHTDPYFTLGVQNNTGEPVILTGVTCEVTKLAQFAATWESGPLLEVGTVDFDLSDTKDGAVLEAALLSQVKIAPKDAVAIGVRIKSRFKYLYLVKLTVWNGDKCITSGPSFMLWF